MPLVQAHVYVGYPIDIQNVSDDDTIHETLVQEINKINPLVTAKHLTFLGELYKPLVLYHQRQYKVIEINTNIGIQGKICAVKDIDCQNIIFTIAKTLGLKLKKKRTFVTLVQEDI